MATQQSDHKRIVRQFVDEVFNEGQLDALDEYLADDYVEHSSAAPEDIVGIEATREYYAGIRAGFPDFHVTIEDLIAEDNKVVQRSRISGTHEGEFLDVPPTGRECEISGIVIYAFDDDEVVEAWAQADIMGLMQQLGVVEAP